MRARRHRTSPDVKALKNLLERIKKRLSAPVQDLDALLSVDPLESVAQRLVDSEVLVATIERARHGDADARLAVGLAFREELNSPRPFPKALRAYLYEAFAGGDL